MSKIEFTKDIALDFWGLVRNMNKMNIQILFMQSEISAEQVSRLGNYSNLCIAGLQYAVTFFNVCTREDIDSGNTLVDELYQLVCKHPRDCFYYLYCFYDHGMAGFISNGSEYLKGFSAYMCDNVPQGEYISQEELDKLVHRH